jgi:hypothetical protein
LTSSDRIAMVADVMRTPFDDFGKQLLRGALEGRGFVETDAEVSVDTRRIDVWFTPGPTGDALAEHLGLFDRMTRAASTVELFHTTPGGDELAGCLIKHGDFRHGLSLRKVPPPVPMQWVISSGRPSSGIDGLWLRPMADWSAGIYEGPPLLWTRLVVVNELPVVPETLMLRLLGAGSVLKQAMVELDALPADAEVRTLAQPVLLRLHLDIRSNPSKQTSDAQDFLMNTQDIVETWRQDAMQEGMKECLFDVYEARFGAMPQDVRVAIEDTHDGAILRSWIKLASTRSNDEINTAIREFAQAERRLASAS